MIANPTREGAMRNLSMSVVALALCTSVATLGCDSITTEPGQADLDETAAASHQEIDGENATSVNGGGHIRDGDWDVSFGGKAEITSSGFDGDMTVEFHNVSVSTVDGGTFEATSVDDMKFFEDNSDSCDAAMNMTLTGTFNGEAGWSLIFRAGDAGHTTENDLDDTVRFQLSNPTGSEVYDTHDVDFTDESNCVGSARTGLDAGNVKIK